MRAAEKDGLYTEQQLFQFYARFNEVYFGNKLPGRVQITYADELAQTCPDAVACVERYCVLGNGCYDLYHIRFLRDFFRGRHPHLILCSLLHEMVHIYVHQVDPSKANGHGALFRAACGKLQAAGWSVGKVLNTGVRAFEPRDRRHELSRPFWMVLRQLTVFVARTLRGLGRLSNLGDREH